MPEFRSRPHEIKAFQFTGDMTIIPPQWFIDAYHRGEVQITNNSKSKYITIYGASDYSDQSEKALLNWWVCQSEHGKIYSLDDKTFKKDYVEIEENK